jgi:hypothetical protein
MHYETPDGNDAIIRLACRTAAIGALLAFFATSSVAVDAPPGLPFQKIIEAATHALENGDFKRLGELEAYLSPEFDGFARAHGGDPRADYEAGVKAGSAEAVEGVLVRLAYDDMKARLSAPSSDEDTLRAQVQLAYLDYHFAISKRVLYVKFTADGDIRNCFRRAYQSPHGPWKEELLRKVAPFMAGGRGL